MNTSLLGLRRLGTAAQKRGQWLLLYGGSSEDGMGPGVYVGRTENAAQAREYLASKVESNPYSTGYVLVVDDEHCYMARSVAVFDRLIQREEGK